MRIERRLIPPPGPGRRALVASVVLGVSASGLVVVQAFLLARLLGSVLGARPGRAFSFAWGLAGLAAVAVMRAAVSWAAEAASARAAADLRLSLRDRLVARLLTLGPRFTSEERSGELAATAGPGVESTDAYVARYLPQLGSSVAVPLLVAAAVFSRDTLSGLVLCLTWPLIPLFMYLIGGAARQQARAQWLTLTRMSSRFLDAVQGVSTIVGFGGEKDEAAVIGRASERFRTISFGVLRIAFLSALTLEWLATLGTAVVAVQLGLRLLYGRVGFEAALFVLIVAPEFYRPLRGLGAAFHAAMTGREATERMAAILDSPEARPDAHRPRASDGSRAAPQIGDLALDRVSFRYAADGPLVLDELTLRIPLGGTTALVGPSGSGKSTISQLLLRFLEPDRGRILVGSRSLAAIDADEWRRSVAWVPQRPHLFHGSVLDNLLLARPDATRTDIERALTLSRAEDIVSGLARGLDAPVGEAGVLLSGGQVQRLALARAFLKDAPLIILDEPTSNLDPENDELVSAAIKELARGRTVLLIAHRLATVADADSIVVLAGGRVVEAGPHESLVVRGGLYADMVAAARVSP